MLAAPCDCWEMQPKTMALCTFIQLEIRNTRRISLKKAKFLRVAAL